MSSKITRRSFLNRTACGIGTIAFSSTALPFTQVSCTSSGIGSNKKKLLATTDYFDNILHGKFLFDRIHLDALHKYLASLGVTRHQWILDTIWNFYDPRQGGFDLLAEAVQSAHTHGLEFYAEIKPFEGGGFSSPHPHSLPFPEKAVALKDMRGIFPIARPFVAENPHLCLKRRPGTYEFKGPVSAIRLVKGDNNPTRVKPEHLSIWTSNKNNGYQLYKGPVSFRESTEWRATYPKSQVCRIIHIEGLELPENHKYILIRCSLTDKDGDFTNERGSIIEIISPDGNNIPFIQSTGQENYEDHRSLYDNCLYDDIVRYFRLPEVKSEFTDTVKAQEHYNDFYNFEENIKITTPLTLDKVGYIAVACGKPEYMLGNLHPIYPEVRNHWLDMVRFCLDKGVDGINIRTSNHTRSPEEWEYGFNEPVLEAAKGKTDYPEIRKINGSAYTQFLREARELIRKRGKNLTIHLYSQMLMPDDRSHQLNYIPQNFEWQWETWVREIADDLEFRGAWTLRQWNLQQVLETFSAVTREASKPFYFQGNMKELKFQDPDNYPFTRRELEMVKNDQAWNGFVLYETANFTRINKDGGLEGSPGLEQLVKKYFI